MMAQEMTRQSDFFYLLGERRLIGRVTETRFNGYRATLAGGWWVAYGPTREAAIRSVVSRYNVEAERYGRELIKWVKSDSMI